MTWDSSTSQSNHSTNPGERFTLQASDGNARTGRLRLSRGTVQTPAFMPVGTQATVKALSPDDLRRLGAEIILANTYHLMLRPGAELIETLGGVSRFMSWNGPVLTDSGGFQVYSLASRRKLTETGVEFQSHLDGSYHELTPELSIQIQFQLGADIIMALDVCAGYDAGEPEQIEAMDLTHGWLEANIHAFQSGLETSSLDPRPLLFGISQGGFDVDRRQRSAALLASSIVDGCAIGGLSVGEPKDVMATMLQASISNLPWDRPRYLMGVGSPEDIWHAVGAGVDMFDCVHPSRVARHGGLFTEDGRINAKAARFRDTDDPIEGGCDCYTCSTFSLAYINHLYRAGEVLVYRLATIHNLRFMARLTDRIRSAVQDGTFEEAKTDFLDRYKPVGEQVRQEQRRRFASRNAGR